MTKVKFNLDDELAILLQAYQDQSGTDRDAIINQAVKQLLVKKLRKEMLAAAKELDFERAAFLRDKVRKLEEMEMALR